MSKLRAAVVCDNYKIATFKRILKQAGYEIAKESPFTKESTTLVVLTDSISELTPVIRTCERVAKAGRQE